MLYYRVADPVVEGEELPPEEINSRILQELKMTGIVPASKPQTCLYAQ